MLQCNKFFGRDSALSASIGYAALQHIDHHVSLVHRHPPLLCSLAAGPEAGGQWLAGGWRGGDAAGLGALMRALLAHRAGAVAIHDGWLGTPELPGYRAGNVVARLSDLPDVDADHLYFNLLLLDADGQLQDLHSGPCPTMHRQLAIADRSRYVRVVAELVRHAPSDDRGLSALGPALNFLRERGIQGDRLMLAAQLLDDTSSDAAVVANLVHLLTLSLGADEARREIDAVLDQLPSASSSAAPRAQGRNVAAVGPATDPVPPGPAGLTVQVTRLVQRLGKAKARRYLRSHIDLALVPDPHSLGV